MLKRIVGTALTALLVAFVYVEFWPGREPLRDAVNRQFPILGDIRERLVGGPSPTSRAERFRIVTTRDDYQREVTTALALFDNADGTIAQAKIDCVPPGSERPGGPNEIADSIAPGAKLGCPPGFKCAARMQLAFFNVWTPAPLVSTAFAEGLPKILVVFQANDLSSGDTGKYLVPLMEGETAYYDNAVSIEIPTSGKPLTKWLYRFDIQRRSTPMDVPLDYTQPELASFLMRCDKAPPTLQRAANNGSPVFKPPPVYPWTVRAAEIEGDVELAITIDPDGWVSDVGVIKTSWSPKRDLKWSPGEEFNKAAVSAVRRWHYRPTGRQIHSKVSISFRLTDGIDADAPLSSLERSRDSR